MMKGRGVSHRSDNIRTTGKTRLIDLMIHRSAPTRKKSFAPFALTGLMMILLAFPGRLTAQDGRIRIQVDGVSVDSDDSPLIENSRVMIPLRAVVEYLNGKVLWYPDEQQVIGFRGARGFDLTIGAPGANLSDGTVYALDTPAMIVRGRTYVPLRFVSEALGCQVEWDDASRTASITTFPVETRREVEALTTPVLLKVITDKGAASGFFFSKDGQVITSAFIAKGAVWIRVVTSEGLEYQAEAIIVDTQWNLAKLRVIGTSGEQFPVFRYFDDFSGVEAGEPVFALGCPPVAYEPLSQGAISVKTVNHEGRGGINTYDVTAAITSENNGGPLVKENGAILGVNCFIAEEENAAPDAYVIPVEYIFTMRNR